MSLRSDVRKYPVAVLGAGPVGIAAAAQLLKRGMPFFLLEATSAVGASLLDYGHVRLFSPWRYNIDPIVRELLLATGWQAPRDGDLPLAREVVERVLRPFSELPDVAPHLTLSTQVISIAREGIDKVKTAGRTEAPFVIQVRQGATMTEHRASAVIDATGTWMNPNPLGSNGLEALGEQEARSSISYGVPDVLGADRARFAGKRTLVVGAGHSAANTLARLGDVGMCFRRDEADLGGEVTHPHARIWRWRCRCLTGSRPVGVHRCGRSETVEAWSSSMAFVSMPWSVRMGA